MPSPAPRLAELARGTLSQRERAMVGSIMRYLKKLFARQLRKDPTQQEEKVWRYLKNKKVLGLKFRRQHVIEGFVVDFFCRELNLAIEVDGKIHDRQKEYDLARQRIIESKDVRFIRISNEDIENGIDNLLTKILALKQTSPLPPGEGWPQAGVRANGSARPKAFTLIELIVTIVILGIIAAAGASFFFPVLNMFFAAPVQVRSQQIGNFIADNCIEGSPSSEGFRMMKSIVSASDTSINYLRLPDSSSITLSWSNATKKLTKTDPSGSYVLPKEYSSNEMSLDGQTAGIIFKYYDLAGNVIASPVATPANIARIEMNWKIYTGSADFHKLEAKYLLNTGVAIKQF